VADPSGGVSQVQLLTAMAFIGADKALTGVTGNRSTGRIVWSGGTVWSEFDFNALNALFEIAGL